MIVWEHNSHFGWRSCNLNRCQKSCNLKFADSWFWFLKVSGSSAEKVAPKSLHCGQCHSSDATLGHKWISLRSIRAFGWVISPSRSTFEYWSVSVNNGLEFVRWILITFKLISCVYHSQWSRRASKFLRSIAMAAMELMEPELPLQARQLTSWSFHSHSQVVAEGCKESDRVIGVHTEKYWETLFVISY